ncbi:MAG: hypothetical protein J5964_07700 [Eubacterium sp.]|nr:hypothetical protein [Eubacterium sp.]
MNTDSIEQKIIYYLKIYDGRYNPTYKKVKEYIISNAVTEREKNYYCLMIDSCFNTLVLKQQISVIHSDEMDDKQLFESEHRNEVFYRIND